LGPTDHRQKVEAGIALLADRATGNTQPTDWSEPLHEPNEIASSGLLFRGLALVLATVQPHVEAFLPPDQAAAGFDIDSRRFFEKRPDGSLRRFAMHGDLELVRTTKKAYRMTCLANRAPTVEVAMRAMDRVLEAADEAANVDRASKALERPAGTSAI